MLKRVILSLAILFLIYTLLATLSDNLLEDIKWILFKRYYVVEIKDTIKKYNKIFTDLYASQGGITMLDEFPASVVLKHEIYRDIDFLGSQNLLIVYDMADSTFMDIKILSPYYAIVDLYEEWNYVYQDNISRRIKSPVKGMGRGFRYHLKKIKGRWIVFDTETIDIEPPDKKTIYY